MKNRILYAVMAFWPVAAAAESFTPVPMQDLARQVAPLIPTYALSGMDVSQAKLGSSTVGVAIDNAVAQAAIAQAAAEQASASASMAIPVTQKGAPGGVASLDATGSIAAPVTGSVSAAMVGSQTVSAALSSQTSALTAETSRAQAAEQALSGSITASAQAMVPLTAVGSANGVAALDASKRISSPVASDISAGTVSGTPLSTILAAQAATLATMVPKSAVGAASGVAALDKNGNVSSPVTGSVASAAVGSQTVSSAFAAQTTALTSEQARAETAEQALSSSLESGLQTAVRTSSVGADNGVAALDASGNVKNPVASDISSGTVSGETLSNILTAQKTDIANAIPLTQKAAASGVASLNADGLVAQGVAGPLDSATVDGQTLPAALAAKVASNLVGAASGVAPLDASARYAGGLSNPTIFAGQAGSVAIVAGGAYAPSDLPVVFTMTPNETGETAAVVANDYGVTSARIVTAGTGCPANAIFTEPASGAQITVTDGNGVAGASVSVTAAGLAPVDTVPANPFKATSGYTGCTAPVFNLSWTVSKVSLTNTGWGYTAAPTGTGSASTAPDAAVATVSTTIATSSMNLSDKLIPTSRIGVPSGVAPLDTNGNMPSPVNTAGNVTAQGVAGFGTTPLNYGLAQTDPKWRPGAAFFTSFGDSAASPRTIHFGGLGSANDAYLSVIGQLMGHSDNSGALISFQDTGTEFGANRNGAGGTDGVLEFTKTSNVAPRLEAGADITNSDGIRRTVVLEATDFVVTPAFTPAQMALIQSNGIIRVYTNWKNGNNAAATPHGFSIPNVYYAYMDPTKATATSAGGTKFPVMVDDDSQGPGWRTQNSINAAASAPGANSGDTIDNVSDTTSSAPGLVWKYPDTAVFIGMSDGKTIHNDMAQYTPGNDSITRAMTGVEYDLLADQTADYQYKVDGVMINVDGNGHELTDDSIEMYLGGGIKHHLQIGDAFCGQYGIETSGFSLNGQCPLTTANSGVNIAKFQGTTSAGHHEAMVFSMSSGADPANLTQNSMALTGGIDPSDTSTTTSWGTALAALKWNSDGDMQSLALCGGQFGAYCNIVASGDSTVKLKGATVVSAPMSFTPGMDLFFQSATSNTDAYLYGAGNGVIGIGTGISGGGGLAMPGILNVGGAATFSGQVSLTKGMDLFFQSAASNSDVYLYGAGNGVLGIGTGIEGGGGITMPGSMSVGKTLSVSGAGTFNGQVALNNSATWTGNLIAEAGAQLMFQNATSTTAAYFTVDSLGNFLEHTGQTTGGGFGVTPRTYSQLASTGLTAGTQSYCTDCYQKSASGTPAGIPVWWNGSAWTSSDGIAAGHP